ncbi:fam-a protein [Plasmodium yoelii]|uniref:Fam-a protein n=2 Tax=Plasmodium yoelii TaxID=5861 RepID=A0AAF0B5E1_PLAYO|nr:fam-a protein [Plasmodium yoelii]WBY58244.1 fam-a protein [Plasmodium yoelii yoelii]CDU85269.1 fam-a protein [Plasmodium yoelii]VTZ79164.1 fam-a protein [Plasmodium yoelii]|eukprot:XP_022813429.1 fam-a protein [Plasmodium yoelii]
MNRFYIQIVLFLLIISLYVNNKTLATEPVPEDTTPEETLDLTIDTTHQYPTSEEIYEANKHLLCTNPEETIQAEKLMNEAVTHLEYHATSKHAYRLFGEYHPKRMYLYKKKLKDYTKVRKVEYIIDDPNKYNKIINKLWDPDSDSYFYKGSVKRKIARVYTPNLVLIQHRSKKWPWSREKYFYALAAKFEVSEDQTIIVIASANINDHNPSNKEYQNTIIKNANLFTTEIDSEDDIRKGKLKKTVVNLIGYIIKKKDKYVDITYVESIDRHVPSYLKRMITQVLEFVFIHK